MIETQTNPIAVQTTTGFGDRDPDCDVADLFGLEDIVRGLRGR